MSLPKPVPLKKEKANLMIPEDELMFWIENNVDTNGVDIVRVRDHFLWSNGDIERHRIDLFEKYEIEGEGEFCWTNRISDRSFFLQYNKSTKTIIDKTLGKVEEKQKHTSKLNGISNGSERIGKSFR